MNKDQLDALTAGITRQIKGEPAPAPDRLGDAMREMANTMAQHGNERLRFKVVGHGVVAVYELQLIGVYPKRAQRRPYAGEVLIEVEAFGPEPQGSRQMAGKK